MGSRSACATSNPRSRCQMQLEDLTAGQDVRFTYDGEIYEGALVGFTDDETVVLHVEGSPADADQAGELLEVESSSLVGARKSAFERLLVSDPELAADLMTEELTALMGPQDAGGLLEASLNQTWARMAKLGGRDQATAR